MVTFVECRGPICAQRGGRQLWLDNMMCGKVCVYCALATEKGVKEELILQVEQLKEQIENLKNRRCQ